MSDAGTVAAILAGAGTIMSGAIGIYINTRLQGLATRSDAERLREDIKKNTVAIKSIENEFSRSDYMMKAELSYRERQLSTLYGPIYGYLKSQHKIYDLWVENKLVHQNLAVKKLFKEQNEKMRQILINNTHLLEDARMQEYVANFFTSTLIFDWYAADKDDGEVPAHLENLEVVKFPKDFQRHIFETTERLKSRIQTLNAQFAMPLRQEVVEDQGAIAGDAG
ncbi:hypothetical protein [Methylobacterium sp. B1]|uniref:hypothetical protein n=1 Tax=Methylobacterium sp. B1 TaxID=91459 RepID=UPI0011D18A3F|nr:hypothetical protein [Methylobacterium sp. B1]